MAAFMKVGGMRQSALMQMLRLLRRIRPLRVRQRLFYFIISRFGLPDGPTKKEDICLVDAAVDRQFADNIVLQLHPTDIGHAAIRWTGFWELSVSRRLVRLARREGGLLVDVGANYGYYSLLWLAGNRQNRVIAVEPSPRNLGALVNNLARNGLSDRAQVLAIAAGRDEYEGHFELGSPDQVGWGGLVRENKGTAIPVRVASLDTVLRDEAHVSVLKIDVEGADTWVLEGARMLLRRHRIRHIFFEENRDRMRALGINPEDAPKLLRSCGYRLQRLAQMEWYATCA